jgi:class 3 adenylate cyclase/tetratricopeptide (TPR) repeat protein
VSFVALEETLPLPGPPPEPPAKPGLAPIFVGKYEVLEKLGQGGMGTVYRAKDTRLNRFVALKFLSKDLTTRPEFKHRFTQEAQAASATEHVNICTIFEIDETASGQTFIGMALYEGETVRDKIRRGPLTIEESLAIVTQLAQGLSQAHQRAIVHRDIKPANIMVTTEGTVKILDFGLAKLGGLSDLTQAFQVVGTVIYMSPEQARGDDVDRRTDLWSAGIVFYQMLTGRLPFQGDHAQAYLHSLLNDQPVPPSAFRDGLPEEAEDIILKCLQKAPLDRYGSAEELLEDLAKLKSALARKAAHPAIGQKLGPERTAETERRLATVMFAEIVGYSEIVRSLDVEEAPRFVSRLLTVLSSSCTRYGGRVDKLAENVLMAVFGVPQSLEDSPKKAVNAAIEMREGLARFNRDEGLAQPLGIRIGIQTGMIIAGPRGPGDADDYSVMGEPVDLGLQLKDASSTGEISVGALTYRHTRTEFDYQELKPLVPKDRKDPVPIFQLRTAKARVHRAPLGSDRMIFSEMVGRDGELDRLKLLVLKVINGEGAIVSVIGEAGIGKSRLIAELTHRDEMKRVNFLLGRALSFGQNLSFHPLIDILRSWAGIADEDTAEGSYQKLEKAIRDVHPEGVKEVFPFIATLMGIKLSGAYAERMEAVLGESLEKLIMKSLREVLVKAAALKPLVLVIEDLHWADLSSIELLGSLYRLAESNRILFISVFRPNYEETSERLLKTIRTRYARLATEIYLERLDGRECETLVENLLNTKDLPDRIMGLIAKQADGNPFFIEEVARSFIDDGIVERKNGRFHVTDKIDSVVIPETIHDVIMARVDKLDEQTKSLLKIASVIGRYFFYSILAAVARSIREIDDKLEYLKEVQIIRERRQRAELEYLFKHALARESVYSSILLKTRKSLHLSIAQAIEKVFADRLNEFYGMLALHYSLGEDLGKAEEYLNKAGEEALKAAASSEAIHYYQEALKVYLQTHEDRRDPGRIAVLEKNIGLAFLHKGRLVDAVEHLDKALDIWGWKRPRFKLIALLRFFYNVGYILKGVYFPRRRSKKAPPEGYSETFDILMKRATALVTYDPFRFLLDSVATIKALIEYDYTKIKNGAVTAHSSSAIFAFTGKSIALSRKINECFEYAAVEEDVKTRLTFNFYKFLNNFLSGRWDELPAYDEELIDENLKIGEFFLAPASHIFLGLQSAETGDFATAAFCVDKLVRIGEDYENDYSRSRKSIVKGQLQLKQRKLTEVLRTVDEEQAFQKAIGQNPLVILYMLGLKAHVQLIQGDRIAAEETLRAAKTITLQKKHIYPYFISNYQIARFLSDVQALEEEVRSPRPNGGGSAVAALRKKAFRNGRACLKTSRKYSADKTEVYRLMGDLCWASGRARKAEEWWGQSVRAGEALGARPELGRTYLEIGRRLTEAPDRLRGFEGLSAEGCFSKAEALFRALSLTRDLEELERSRSPFAAGGANP